MHPRLNLLSAPFLERQAILTARDTAMLIRSVAQHAVRVNRKAALRILSDCLDALRDVRPEAEPLEYKCPMKASKPHE